MPRTDRRSDDGAQYIEVWNDLVSPRDLTWSIVLCGGTTAAALGIATALHSDEFFWGLGGAVLGFVAAALVFPPKRVVSIGTGHTDISATAGGTTPTTAPTGGTTPTAAGGTTPTTAPTGGTTDHSGEDA